MSFSEPRVTFLSNFASLFGVMRHNSSVLFYQWHEELGELSLDHSKSEKLYIDGFFLSKAYNVSARKFQWKYVSLHWRAMQNLRKTDSWLEKSHKEFGQFSCELSKVWKFEFWWASFFSKAYKGLDEKVLKSCVSWNSRVMQSLKKK